MDLTNTTAHDLIFNVDSGTSLKGQQYRTPIQALDTATISFQQILMLVMITNFQDAIADGDITVDSYSWGDVLACLMVLWLINGIL